MNLYMNKGKLVLNKTLKGKHSFKILKQLSSTKK